METTSLKVNQQLFNEILSCMKHRSICVIQREIEKMETEKKGEREVSIE